MARLGPRKRQQAAPVPPRELTELPGDPNAEITDYDAARVWIDWLGKRDDWARENGHDLDDWLIG